MKRMMLMLLISSNCFAYRGYMPAYREMQIDDVIDKQAREENQRLRRENERLARINTRPQVVYVRNHNHFEWLNEGDKTAIKYLIAGLVLGFLILR